MLLARLRVADQIVWSRVIVDSSSIRAVGSGQKQDRVQQTARDKHHLITEAQGIPLAMLLTGANRNDITQLQALVEAIPPIRGKRGKALSEPRVVQGDSGHDYTNIEVHCIPLALQPKSLDVVSLMEVGWAKHAGLLSGHLAATQLPPTAHQLRTARFPPRGFPRNRMLHHMLATPEKVILITPLRFSAGGGAAQGHQDSMGKY